MSDLTFKEAFGFCPEAVEEIGSFVREAIMSHPLFVKATCFDADASWDSAAFLERRATAMLFLIAHQSI